MNNSENESHTSGQDPPATSEAQNATSFERWRKKAWRAAGFALTDDEKLESMTRSCEKQRDYLMNYSAYKMYLSDVIPTADFNPLIRSDCRIYA